MKNTLVILVLTFVAACSKYEEGPDITFLSKEKRLIGEWESQEILYNYRPSNITTTDTLYYFCNSLPVYITQELKKTYKIESDGTLYLTSTYVNTVYQEGENCEYSANVTETSSNKEGTWHWKSNKQYIVFELEKREEWQIVRLAKDELKLRRDDSNYIPYEENYIKK